MNVFILRVPSQYCFRKSTQSTFLPMLNQKNKEAIISFTKKTNNLFNGNIVRLDSIKHSDDNVLQFDISMVTYYDSMTTNMLYHKYHDKLGQLDDNKPVEKNIKSIINNISNMGISSFTEIINNPFLANPLAVSVMIRDIDNDYCMVRRKNNLAVGASLLSVTVTGGVDDVDYETENPIISCAKRELMEELFLQCNDLSLDYIAISKTKLQPIAIVNGKINDKWENITTNFARATDFSNEVNGFFIIHKEQLPAFIKNNKMTDAAYFHIHSIVSC